MRTLPASRACSALVMIAALSGMAVLPAVRAEEPPPIKSLATPSGVEFALVGERRDAPAPTLLVFAADKRGSLAYEDNNRLGLLLAARGYLCVSLDLPCHGADVRPGEKPADLAAWRTRIEQGEDIAAETSRKVSQVLDYLVAEKYTDPKRVVASGTSRGGFIALHCAAADPRIQYVIAFAPVTHLPTLAEFSGTEKPEAAAALSPIRVADKLVGKSIWMMIGNNDLRVGTGDCIDLAREIVRKSTGKVTPVPLELHLVGTINHRLHAKATPEYKQTCSPHDEAAAWLMTQIPN